jgi:hypothetical protein
MNSENNPSASSSATTSPGGQHKPEHPDPRDPKKEVNEADYITREAELAKAAISGVIKDMKQALAQGTDVREWTRQHPLIVTGSAIAAGFIAGMLVTPTKEDTYKNFFEEKWEYLRDKFTPPTTATAAVGTEAPPKPVQEEKGSVVSTIIREAIKAIGPTIGGLITAALASQQPDPSPAQGDGHTSATQTTAA